MIENLTKSISNAIEFFANNNLMMILFVIGIISLGIKMAMGILNYSPDNYNCTNYNCDELIQVDNEEEIAIALLNYAKIEDDKEDIMNIGRCKFCGAPLRERKCEYCDTIN